jgi:3-oxoacyl-[acyl-carrier-protein] synthase II
MRRVVITGMGAITPLGCSVREFGSGLRAGRNGAGLITRFDARTFPCRVAAEVKGFDPAAHDPGTGWWAKAGLNTWFAVAAAAEAVADAGLGVRRPDPARSGVYVGAGEGEQHFHLLMSIVARSYRPECRSLDSGAFNEMALRGYDPASTLEQEMHTTAARLGELLGLEGPNYSCLTACAAGAQAIGEATDLIRHGDADLMLAGGSHSIINPLAITGFTRLSALSARSDDPARASRPFDLKRDGFVPGEGAALVVLEELGHARSRGARIHAEVTGYGATADAYRLTDGHPEGRNIIACMSRALADAGLAPADIGYINAHGTSTPFNDRVETQAIKAVFGEAAYRVPVSSTKSMTGHLVAAAGAVETVAGVLAITRALLPPTINYEFPDPECDLDYVPNRAREQRVDHVLNNSFGFGGQNVCLVLSRFTG